MYHSTITWIIAIMMKNDVHGRSDPGMFLQTNGKVELLRFSLSSNIRQRTKKKWGAGNQSHPHPHPLSLNLASMMVMRFQGGSSNPRFLPAHSMISIVGLMWRMDTFKNGHFRTDIVSACSVYYVVSCSERSEMASGWVDSWTNRHQKKRDKNKFLFRHWYEREEDDLVCELFSLGHIPSWNWPIG